MRKYYQLTEEDRIEIYAMMQAGISQAQIADRLAVHRSTIWRELQRNIGFRGYRPKQAHQKALQRRHDSHKAVKMTDKMIKYLEDKLKQDFSPEQIAERMKLDPDWKGPTVSHERIYRHIWQDKAAGGKLYKHLRIAGHKKKRKRYRSKDSRGKIPNRVGIEHRPKIVETKKRIGDWEADTIIGKDHKGAMVTLVERKSKLTAIGKLARNTAEAAQEQIVRLLAPHKSRVYTITADNGREFANHETFAKELKADVYFARPYHSWERGLNENTNGLIRQYFPKGTDLRKVTDEQLIFVMTRLNNRPRKSLGFKTPNEVFYKSLTQKDSLVALVS